MRFRTVVILTAIAFFAAQGRIAYIAFFMPDRYSLDFICPIVRPAVCGLLSVLVVFATVGILRFAAKRC